LKVQLKERLRHYWHELYYKLASPAGVEFGMRCKHVVEQIDLGDEPATWRGWFRLKLHLSFCQACNYYFKASKALRRAVQEMAKSSSQTAIDLEKINQELLKKYTRARGSSDA
jgi:tagatose-1,6-bisphosphate aldolase non-catalytic subunit AgaZ/GatZ